MIEPLTRGRTKAPERKKILPVSRENVDAVLPHLPRATFGRQPSLRDEFIQISTYAIKGL